jgi:hypothetical protein
MIIIISPLYDSHYLSKIYYPVDKSINNSESCLTPVEKIAFPVGIPLNKSDEVKIIPPQGEWVKKATIPEDISHWTPSLLLVGNEIWVYNIGENLLIFNLETNKWKEIKNFDSKQIIPNTIFNTKNGQLFGFDFFLQMKTGESQYLISIYNKNTSKFEQIPDESNNLAKVTAYGFPLTIAEDTNGELWFFGYGYKDKTFSLYSYDPVNNLLIQRQDLLKGDTYIGPVISPNQDVWFYQRSENKLFYYSIKDKTMNTYYGLPDFTQLIHDRKSVMTLFFDTDGQLLVDNLGWINFSDPTNPLWYEIIPSPEFVTDQADYYTDNPEGFRPKTRYALERPLHIFQSSDGNLWYSVYHGIIRLDRKTEQWCKISTGFSEVVEDSQNNLWIVLPDGVYSEHIQS